MLTDLLVARLDVAFDHQTFDHLADVRIIAAAVKYFLSDTNLFFVFFTRVSMVAVDDTGGIEQIALTVHLME